MNNNDKIRDFILESNIFNEDEIKEAEELSFKENLDLVESLIKLGYLDQKILTEITSALMGFPKVDLKKEVIDLETYSLIPDLIADEYDLISFKKKDDEVWVAFHKVDSLEVLDEIFPNYNLRIFWTDKDDIFEKKNEYFNLLKDELNFKTDNLSSKILKPSDFALEKDEIPERYFSDLVNDLYLDKFLNSLFEYAIRSSAEMIFFNFYEDKVVLNFRIFDRNYKILELDRGVYDSVVLKLKYISDINLLKTDLVKQGNFIKRINDKDYHFFVSFINTESGEVVNLQIDKDKKFQLPFLFLEKKQQDLILKYRKKDSGFNFIFGDEKSIKRVLYYFLEFDIEKNKNIYLLEKEVKYYFDFVKQIELKNKKNYLNLLKKITQLFPDTLAVEKITKSSLDLLFNFVSSSKKVFYFSKESIGDFLDLFLERNYDRGLIYKNLGILINVIEVNELNSENRTNYSLTKDEESLIKSFLKEDEVKELFEEEGYKKEARKRLREINFYTLKKKKGFFAKKNKEISIPNKESLMAVLDLSLFFEKEFLKKNIKEKIKNNLRSEVKKEFLKNALILSYRGLVDIKEVLKILTKIK